MNRFLFRHFIRSVKNVLIPVSALAIVFAAAATAQQPPQTGRQIKLALAPRSNVDPVEIMKHLSKDCPGVTLTTNQRNSDFMLYAGGWSGSYRFMVIQKGGDVIYTTETSFLSNSVKDVCKFLNSRS